MKNICASCESVSVEKVIKTDNSRLPMWLQKKDYVLDFIESVPVKLYQQKKYDTKLDVSFGLSKANKYVLYWAAKSNVGMKIKNAKTAYGNFSNYGVAKTNNNGIATLFFNCPQPYSTMECDKKTPETFYRHIHMSFSNKDLSGWLSTVYTKVVVCNLSLKETMALHKKQEIVLINALPAEYYAKQHIPNSFNLTQKQIKQMSTKELHKWFLDVINTNYLKISNMLKQKKINLYEVPIVFYCAHNKCSAGYNAAIELLKKQFVNVLDYKDGMEEYLKIK